jgi:Tetracyclin repressor-like, C-terminal domain
MMSGGVGPARLQYMESLLKRLREAGFSPRLTHHAYHALDSHIFGFTIWAAGYTRAIKANPGAIEAFLREVPADRYPYFLEHAQVHMTRSGRDGVSEFEFGLELILEGLERLRGTASPGSSSERKTSRSRV